jgi:hypothetical protein
MPELRKSPPAKPWWLAVLGGGASFVQTASNVALLAGVLYLIDCRVTARNRDAVDSCYFQAMTLSGVGIGAKTGFQAGFNTLNPALRRPDADTPEAEPPAPAAAPPPEDDEPPAAPRPDPGRTMRGLINLIR